ELGRGGMAIVFKAKEKQLDREVAIKVLPFSLAFDKEFVERFQREARTSAKLEHPNIIPIYRVGKSGRIIYFVMKFPRGKPLDGRSYIYSLGVVAYQCLTGGVPFDGEDSFSIGYKHIMEEIPTPPLENPEQRQLFEIVRKMMAKTPAQRFQNADELISVLEG